MYPINDAIGISTLYYDLKWSNFFNNLLEDPLVTLEEVNKRLPRYVMAKDMYLNRICLYSLEVVEGEESLKTLNFLQI